MEVILISVLLLLKTLPLRMIVSPITKHPLFILSSISGSPLMQQKPTQHPAIGLSSWTTIGTFISGGSLLRFSWRITMIGISIESLSLLMRSTTTFILYLVNPYAPWNDDGTLLGRTKLSGHVWTPGWRVISEPVSDPVMYVFKFINVSVHLYRRLNGPHLSINSACEVPCTSSRIPLILISSFVSKRTCPLTSCPE